MADESVADQAGSQTADAPLAAITTVPVPGAGCGPAGRDTLHDTVAVVGEGAAAAPRSRFFAVLEAHGIAVASEELGCGWDDADLLLPEERALTSRMAPVRRREFIAGRVLARALMGRLGTAPTPLLPGAGRQPLWPPGLVGSITHSRRFCAVALAPATRISGLGIDFEPFRAIEPELHALICTPAELGSLHAGDWPCSLGELVCCLFSAKEAFYKAWYPLTARFLECHDVKVTLAPGLTEFTVEMEPGIQKIALKIRGDLAIVDGHVSASVMWEAAMPPPR